jgi:glycosyltransferase involved in cell wall biosynthesis
MGIRTSGVIATYNQQHFIRESVESLAGQVDELIVVDDCSADDTAVVLAELESDRVRVIRNPVRSGVSRSFNTAVAAARGEIIIIQGGDDRSLPGRVERQVRSLDDPEIVLSASAPIVISEQGEVLPDWVASEFFPQEEIGETVVWLYTVGNLICAPAVALRRTDYLELGGFHPGLDHLQDFHLWLTLADRGSFAILDRPVVEYRKHSTNLSRAHLGVDSPRLRRIRAEWEFTLTDFLERASHETLAILAVAAGIHSPGFDGLGHEQRVALLELHHDNRLLVRRGLAFLLKELGTPGGIDSLARMGLSPADLDRFAVLADHEDGESVGRALRAGAAYSAGAAHSAGAAYSGLAAQRGRTRSIFSRAKGDTA